MSILMLETGGWGGICHYSYNLCQALAEQGAQVILLTAQPYELAGRPHAFAVETPFHAAMPYPVQLRSLIAAFRKHQPKILHVQSMFSARRDWLCFALARLWRLPVVLTAHNVLPHDESEKSAPGMHFAYAQIYRFARRIIAHSQDSRRTLQTLFLLDPSKIAVIPHGNYLFAGQPIAQPDARKRLELPAKCPILLAFGAIRPYKGTDDLIDAFARVASQISDAHLVIVGKPIGLDPDIYRHRINALGLTHRITYRPVYVPIEDIALYFSAADIAVYPYHTIYQSGALQLAYAFSRPVVATDVGAFPETIDPGKNGLIVPARNPEKFADALIDLLSRPQDALAAMGAHSRRLADTRYAWPAIAEQTLAIYRSLVRE